MVLNTISRTMDFVHGRLSDATITVPFVGTVVSVPGLVIRKARRET